VIDWVPGTLISDSDEVARTDISSAEAPAASPDHSAASVPRTHALLHMP
jgi:hypothetical protein